MDTAKALSILGLKPGATVGDIRKAYLALSKAWHPDRNPDTDRTVMEESMKRLNTAYEALKGYMSDGNADSDPFDERHRNKDSHDHTEARRYEYRDPVRQDHGQAIRHTAPRQAVETSLEKSGSASVGSLRNGFRPERLLGPAFRLAFVLLAAGTLFWGVHVAVTIIGGFFTGLGNAALASVETMLAPGPAGTNGDASPRQVASPGSDTPSLSPVWMERNLATKTYRNGDPIPHARSKEEWKAANTMRIGVWCWYEDDPSKGVLYNRHAVNDPRGLAPAGWHVPSEDEWEELSSGGDLSVFFLEQGGFRKTNGRFSHFGTVARFWIAGSRKDNNNMALELDDFDFTHEGDIIDNVGEGFSVRCIKN